ncbi:MAG: hypothetical protein AAGJ52_13675, partial [Pseudomonadota bacterium]
GAPGVYIEGAKVASIGLKVRRGRTYHGLAMNVDMDLNPFGLINPCGYSGLQMTQLIDHIDGINFTEATSRLCASICRQLDYDPVNGAAEFALSLANELALP